MEPSPPNSLTRVRQKPGHVANIRSFNRTITGRLGALESSFLGCGLSLGKARLLFEISSGVGKAGRLRADVPDPAGDLSAALPADV